jgi:hypothetical protein
MTRPSDGAVDEVAMMLALIQNGHPENTPWPTVAAFWRMLDADQQDRYRRMAIAAWNRRTTPTEQWQEAGWQRRYGNGSYVHPNGTKWSNWHSWDEEERPETSGRWSNEYRKTYTPKEPR